MVPLLQPIVANDESWLESLDITELSCKQIDRKLTLVSERLVKIPVVPLLQPIVANDESWLESLDMTELSCEQLLRKLTFVSERLSKRMNPKYLRLHGLIHPHTKLIQMTTHSLVDYVTYDNEIREKQLEGTVMTIEHDMDQPPEICTVIASYASSFATYNYIDVYIDKHHSFENHICMKIVLYSDQYLKLSGTIHPYTKLVDIQNYSYIHVKEFHSEISQRQHTGLVMDIQYDNNNKSNMCESIVSNASIFGNYEKIDLYIDKYKTFDQHVCIKTACYT